MLQRHQATQCALCSRALHDSQWCLRPAWHPRSWLLVNAPPFLVSPLSYTLTGRMRYVHTPVDFVKGPTQRAAKCTYHRARGAGF